MLDEKHALLKAFILSRIDALQKKKGILHIHCNNDEHYYLSFSFCIDGLHVWIIDSEDNGTIANGIEHVTNYILMNTRFYEVNLEPALKTFNTVIS